MSLVDHNSIKFVHHAKECHFGTNSEIERMDEKKVIDVEKFKSSIVPIIAKEVKDVIINQTQERKNSLNSILSPPSSAYETPAIEQGSEKDTEEFVKKKESGEVDDFNLTINSWSHINQDYKQKCIDFLEQYETLSTVKSFGYNFNQKNNKKKVSYESNDSENSDDDGRQNFVEHTKLKKHVKNASRHASSENDNPAPKKRKSKDGSIFLLPLQQKSLIDESIPDYSPSPYTTLNLSDTKCLKVDWKGHHMDLSVDPDIQKLHPAEILLASILRLPVKVYLDSKRRLFFEKVQKLKLGKQFRRTDAQKACRIDVNKASRLFAAFEKVGWLDDSHFLQYID